MVLQLGPAHPAGSDRAVSPVGSAVAISMLVVAVALATASVFPGWLGQHGLIVLMTGFLGGLPHGAMDHLAPFWSGRLRRGRRALALVLAGYLVVAVLTWVLLRLAGPTALPVLLILSVVHFGGRGRHGRTGPPPLHRPQLALLYPGRGRGRGGGGPRWPGRRGADAGLAGSDRPGTGGGVGGLPPPIERTPVGTRGPDVGMRTTHRAGRSATAPSPASRRGRPAQRVVPAGPATRGLRGVLRRLARTAPHRPAAGHRPAESRRPAPRIPLASPPPVRPLSRRAHAHGPGRGYRAAPARPSRGGVSCARLLRCSPSRSPTSSSSR